MEGELSNRADRALRAVHLTALGLLLDNGMHCAVAQGGGATVFRVSPRDIIRLQGAGGEPFTLFVDDLIRGEAAAGGVPDKEIRANLKTTAPDGGVDTQVRVPIPDDPTGRLQHPTVWQYKASAGAVEAAGEEIKEGKYAGELIRSGYAYRLCICDDLAPERSETLRQSFTDRIRAINPDAPEPEIVTASDLAAWAARFPAVVLHHFHRDIGGRFRTLDAWRASATAITPEFVPVPAWEVIAARISEHADFKHEGPEAVLSLRGEAGVGKTRLVYETLAVVDGAPALVIYTDDGDTALELAHRLARDQRAYAIVVADECSLETRARLGDLLRGARNRVRVITIDSSGERPSALQPENQLEKLTDEVVGHILERNFPEVPAERRRGYAALSGGYVRFAAELCRSDMLIAQDGHVAPVLRGIETYLRVRVPDQHLWVLQAASLLTKIGARGDVEHELESLCQMVHMEPRAFIETADRLHDSPGFMGRGGRYYYVTPEIVARATFGMAWQRWGAADPDGFLRKVPGGILQQFLQRVARSASDDVRELVSRFFVDWAGAIQPGQLAEPSIADRLVALVETDPALYLPMLRGLIERSTQEELAAVTGDSHNGRWGPRRHLVWLAERLAAFPEYFDDAEAILLRFALAESEPRIGNNATAIWGQLFRIALSGAAVPFEDRLQRLEECVFSSDSRIAMLALGALAGVLEYRSMRMSGPFVVAGRVRPQEWLPQTNREYAECFRAAVGLLQRAAEAGSVGVRDKARAVAIQKLWGLLDSGHLGVLRSILHLPSLDDATRAKLVSDVADYVRLHREPAQKRRPSESYLRDIETWLASLKPSDFHGRLVTAIGTEPWGHLRPEDEEQWKRELRSLAEECVKHPHLLTEELPWICSGEAKGAAYLGDELAQADEKTTLLEQVFGAVLQHQSALLARGYVLGSLRTRRDRIPRINEWIDRIEGESPALAYDLFIVGSSDTHALERALGLVDAGRLPSTHLAGFTYGDASRSLAATDLGQVLERLLHSVETAEARADRVAVELVASRMHLEQAEALEPVLDDSRVRQLVWRLMELTASDGGHEPYHWGRILEALAQSDPARAARLATIGLTGEGFYQEEYCEQLLTTLASQDPDIVMEQLGTVMLEDSERGLHFHIAVHRTLISALPAETVIGWLQEHGVEAARRLARHLPLPYIGPEGPTVPPLTEFVLTEFEHDEKTFDEFCMGVHSFQMYSGDIAAQHEAEAAKAERFLDHPLKRIREWAHAEIRQSRWEAQQAREREEEYGID